MIKRPKNISTKLTTWIGSTSSIVIHTLFFIGMFCLRFINIPIGDILLILTTLVSLEAIYLAIFIQMTVNRHSEDLVEVSEDIEEIQEDVEEIQEDVEGIEKDVDAIQEDVGELQENIEEISEEEELDDHSIEMKKLEKIEHTLQVLLDEIAHLKK